MFETSLLESGGVLKTQSKRWAIAAFFLNSSLLLTLMIIPLIHPDALPKQVLSMLLVAPPPPPAAPTPIVREADAASTTRSVSQIVGNQLLLPRLIPTHPVMVNDNGVAPVNPFAIPGGTVGGGDVAMSTIFGPHTTPPPVIKQATAPKKPYVVSAGVAAGYLLNKTPPSYPSIARAAHVEGTVILAAVISKAGRIENLRVVSGPTLLQQAAKDAVSSWCYKPHLLNGEPVEVETQINVIFNLSN